MYARPRRHASMNGSRASCACVRIRACTRRAYGPWYLLVFRNQESQVLAVAVSALNTDVLVEDGRLRFPVVRGSNFWVDGIPRNAASEMPMPPEQAAYFAATATGARVDGAPQLIVDGPRLSPSHAAWRVELDRPVDLIIEGLKASTRTVFVAVHPEPSGLLVPTLLWEDDTAARVEAVRFPIPLRLGELDTVEARVRDDMPAALRRAVVDR
jgi:hypothetical protein